jgi:hypothetical protein
MKQDTDPVWDALYKRRSDLLEARAEATEKLDATPEAAALRLVVADLTSLSQEIQNYFESKEDRPVVTMPDRPDGFPDKRRQ